jgi:hypothetical protein
MMDLGFTEDQALFAETLEHWAADHREIPAGSYGEAFLPGEALAEELAANDYFDVALQPGLGALGAVLLIESVGRTPWAIEVAASALVAPMLQISRLARPLAILSSSSAPIARFLTPGGSALIDAGDQIRLLRCDDRVTPVTTRFAYPYGAFEGDLLASSEALGEIKPEELRGWQLLGTVAEAIAAMDSALNLTSDHVRTRTQFGRPLGSFQAVQHRLAEVSAILHGARLLLYRAAVDGIAHVETAAMVAHDAVQRTIYETNQFHGAIGLTLEHPLHLWSYRLRVLQFELAQAIHQAEREYRHEP